MSLRRIDADAALAELAQFDAILDARSPAEFDEDRLPGAVNWPTLDDAERARVGTMYVQGSPFEARKVGAVIAARNIATHIERHAQGLPREWRPLVYCWRGGQRSGALATVLDAIGFQVHVLQGGYREFRRAILRDIATLLPAVRWRVLCGRTGSGKSRLLAALGAAGEQVLDLEGLACHRGSVLGPWPDRPQPSQKAFETALWGALRGIDPQRAVWVESESRMIGRLRVPDDLLAGLRDAPCVAVTMPLEARVSLLMEDYGHFVADVEALGRRLEPLKELHGAATLARWRQQAREGSLRDVVTDLLARHYDPMYERSTTRNFRQFGTALPCPVRDGSPGALEAAASWLTSASATQPPAA